MRGRGVLICLVLIVALALLVQFTSARGRGSRKGSNKAKGIGPNRRGKAKTAPKKKKAQKSKKGSKSKLGANKAGAGAKGASKPRKGKPSMDLAGQDEVGAMNDNPAIRQLFLQRVRALGATYVRQMASVGSLDKCLGQPSTDNANRLIRLIQDAKKVGLKVQLDITGSATSWSDICGHPKGSLMPMKDWKKFVQTWVPFFYNAGVRRFGIWNEPNHPAYNCAGSVTQSAFVDDVKCNAKSAANRKRYLQLYTTAYKTITAMQKKGQVKKAKIWFGEFAGNGLEWASKMMKGKKIKADAFSWHPYQYCSPPEIKGKTFPVKTCKRLTSGISWTPDVQRTLKNWAKSKTLTTRKGGKVPMYMTEFGYHTQGKYALPEPLRAKFYVRALQWAKRHGTKGFVLFQFIPSPPGSAWDTSLLKAEGFSYVPTASYRAIHKWATAQGYKTQPI